MLKLQVEPGGELYLQFAKRKLAEMKTWMRESEVRAFTKNIFATTGAHIMLRTMLIPETGDLDFIRITTAARGLWDFYVDGTNVWCGNISKGSLTATTLDAATLSARTLGRSWLLGLEGTQRKVIDPNMTVTRVRGGEYDSGWTPELFSADSIRWAAVFSKAAPATRHFVTEDSVVSVPTTPSTEALVPHYADVYYGETTSVIVPPSIEGTLYRRDGSSVTLTNTDGTVKFASSRLDSVIVAINDLGAVLMSMTSGVLGSRHDVSPLGGLSFSSPDLEGAANNKDVYLLASGETFDAGGPPFFTWYAAVVKFSGMLAPDTGALTGYSTSYQVFSDPGIDAVDTAGGGLITPTRNGAFLLFQSTTGGGANFNTYIADATGGGKRLVDTNGSSWPNVAAAAGTPNKAWFLLHPFGGSNLEFHTFESAGPVFSGFSGAPPVHYMGRFGDHVYFRVETAANQWDVIGSDGTRFDARSNLPAGFSPGSGIGGSTWRKAIDGAHWVWGGTVPTSVPYVFHKSRANALKSYGISSAEISPTVNTPTSTTLFAAEDVEDI